MSEVIHGGTLILANVGQPAISVRIGYDPPKDKQSDGERELRLQRSYIIAAAKTDANYTRANHPGCAPG